MTIGKTILKAGRLAPAGLLAVGIAGCAGPNQANTVADAPKVVQAAVQTIAETSVPGTYEAVGTVKARLNAILASKVMGRVVSVSAREGDTVVKGQLVVTLDSRELEASVRMAAAGYHSSVVGVENALTTAAIEEQSNSARIAQAESQVSQSKAALAAAVARQDLVLAGPRVQDVSKSHLAVMQAASNMKLAKLQLDRTSTLVAEGALARRDLDLAQNRYDVAQGQLGIATQSESVAREGSRSQDIRAAQDAVRQAAGALGQAQSAVAQAKAEAMQNAVRRKEVDVAKSQVLVASATMQSAEVGLSYARVSAPFDGRVVQRFVDPGAMASPGVPLVEVEGGEYQLEAVVPESVLRSVSLGASVDVTIDALSGRHLSGRVVEIVPKGDAATHSFVVKVALPAGRQIKSGMYGRVAIRTASERRVLIPASATWEREGLHYVFALNAEGVARLRIVTLGDLLDGKYAVFSGLRVGDRIVVGNLADVADGVRVERGS
ncbi:MAG: efflux RND transporter periplasmic adaptor subunit [Fimbriimonadaceae bacterium]